MQQLRPTDLARQLAQQESARPAILDVREPWEVNICRLEGSIHIPMRELPHRLAELEPARPLVCLCHHGHRSMQVAYFLEHHNFQQVFNLAGGIDAWAKEVDPTCPTY